MTAQRIDIDKVQSTFSGICIDLISASLGGSIVSFSDEFFASASNLITPTAPIQRAGHFIASGAWYDGWETRRHNPSTADWVVIKLGVPSGVVHGVEIDTAFFSGNHAPAVSVQGVFLPGGMPDETTEGRWETILDTQETGPNQRHVWRLERPAEKPVSHVRLNMYPDGGIARFRLLGTVVPVWPDDSEAIVDLAHVANGGFAVSCSDQHYSVKDNLLLPGRGENMGDGWETKRSRQPEHVDWVVVKLGAKGYLEEIIVDTLHFRGNFPQAVEVYGLNAETHDVAADDARWELVVPKSKCAKDTEHAFSSTMMQNVDGKVVSHVKMVIIPDGGVKRLRVFGKRVVGA
ncbi:galactose-binding domain-like protein [Tricharina praecox]|uniref:galactose-binding domain-like protein n=1 Tax=Tricharina praecox TaxID=43433 RepID=UPI00221EEC15|nr:galactose-binding domain-like protein [Tricharina praecox]KAI5848880.1 galactose-binding domain-like protein [Tricharina praecox]